MKSEDFLAHIKANQETAALSAMKTSKQLLVVGKAD